MESFPDIIINDLQLNTDFVTSYYLFGEAVTASEARALKTAAFEALEKSIPEPTTATLSLLALAGLAVRRRR